LEQFCQPILWYTDDGDLLGNLCGYLSTLLPLCREMDCPATPRVWGSRLARLLDDCLAWDDQAEFEAARIREAVDLIQELGETGRTGGTSQEEKDNRDENRDENRDAEISPGVIREILEQELCGIRGAGRFLHGGITFCEMAPMRSIPFAVICMLGMDEDAFPRQEPERDFDLMQKAPKNSIRTGVTMITVSFLRHSCQSVRYW